MDRASGFAPEGSSWRRRPGIPCAAWNCRCLPLNSGDGFTITMRVSPERRKRTSFLRPGSAVAADKQLPRARREAKAGDTLHRSDRELRERVSKFRSLAQDLQQGRSRCPGVPANTWFVNTCICL